MKKYAAKMKGEGTTVNDVVERVKKQRLDELENLQIDRLVEEERAKIEEAKNKKGPVDRGLATDFLGHMMQMAQVDPKKAAEFLNALSEEDITKLTYLSSAGQTGNILSLVPFLKSEKMGVKDIVEIVKMMQPGEGSTTLAIFEAQSKYLDKALEMISEKRSKSEDNNGTIPLMREMLQEIREEREARMEDKIAALEKEVKDSRFDPQAYIESVQKQAQALGWTPMRTGGTSETDLKIEEMRETHELKLQEMSLELEKWKYDKEADRQKWDLLGGMFGSTSALFAKPAEDALRSLGRGRSDGFSPTGRKRSPTVVSTELKGPCHSCGEEIVVKPPYPEAVKCPHCGELNRVEVSEQKQEPGKPEA